RRGRGPHGRCWWRGRARAPASLPGRESAASPTTRASMRVSARPAGACRAPRGDDGRLRHGANGQSHVVSPEPERVREGARHAERSGLIRNEIEVAYWIWSFEVDRGWNDPARHGQGGGDRLESAGGTQQVAGH